MGRGFREKGGIQPRLKGGVSVSQVEGDGQREAGEGLLGGGQRVYKRHNNENVKGWKVAQPG